MKTYEVDIFTYHVFGENPAAGGCAQYWLSDDKMQQFSMENNLSETAILFRKLNDNG